MKRLLTFLLSLLVASHVSAREIVVTSTADSSLGSLRQAVMRALPGDVIRFDASIGGETIENESELIIDKTVVIDGTDVIGGIAIEDERFLVQPNSDLTLKGLRLTRGDGGEGAIVQNRGTLCLSDCVIHNNSPDEDHDNEDPEGTIFNMGDLTISHCHITGNWTEGGKGGALYHLRGTTLIEFSTIDNNYGEGGGDAIFHRDGDLTIRHSTIVRNVGHLGIAIESEGRGNLLIENSLVSNAIKWPRGNVVIRNSTMARETVIINNQAVEGSDGLRIGGTLTLENSIVQGHPESTITAGALVEIGENLIATDPMLAPLGYYGGETYSMPPLPNSPAIDAGKTSGDTALTDQRGHQRVTGEGIDLGAVELSLEELAEGAKAQETVVISEGDAGQSNRANPGLGTLRYVLSNAPSDSVIIFHPKLNGRTIRVSAVNERPLRISKDLKLDASALPDGIRINANGRNRVLDISRRSAFVAIDGITFVRGNEEYGGLISNSANLQLKNCHFFEGRAEDGGGAISHGRGELHIEDCTFSNNKSTNDEGGGALLISGGSTVITGSTFVGNQVNHEFFASAIAHYGGSLYIGNSTIVNNGSSESGPAIVNHSTGALTLNHVTIAGNVNAGIVNERGSLKVENSIIVNNGEKNLEGTVELKGINFLEGDPMLAPLGDYGGPTLTRPPLAGSPMIDAGLVSDELPETDQRGLSRISGPAPDLGAYEAGTPLGYRAWAVETVQQGLNATFDGDADGDGVSNGLAYALAGNAPEMAFSGDGHPTIRLRSRPGSEVDLVWTVYRSHDLVDFEQLLQFSASESSGDPAILLKGDPPDFTLIDQSPAAREAFFRMVPTLRGQP